MYFDLQNISNLSQKALFCFLLGQSVFCVAALTFFLNTCHLSHSVNEPIHCTKKKKYKIKKEKEKHTCGT